MRDANLPIQYRDSCANLLIPLNRCRYEEYYLPWKCEVSSSFVELGWFGAGDGKGRGRDGADFGGGSGMRTGGWDLRVDRG